mmetsp:Transcript_5753/g.18172  ORF Transcript_5753/g.18172 Transcript_5753/m.18172 type:complete len:85 (+) Transcript_5753:615-869(+)
MFIVSSYSSKHEVSNGSVTYEFICEMHYCPGISHLWKPWSRMSSLKNCMPINPDKVCVFFDIVHPPFERTEASFARTVEQLPAQ